MTNAVLVVDMLSGFLEEGYPLFCGEDARKIIPSIRRLLERETVVGSRVFFICDNHDADDLEFKMFPPHCINSSAETKVIPQLAKYPGEIIKKKRYSGFFETELEKKLAQLKPDKLIVCGVLTDICVMHTIADARNRDYNVEVPPNCVAALDAETQRFALSHIEKVLGAKLTDSGKD
ncbi:cysteine hydrolase family protein [Chloroflexota bacterium]